MQMCKTVKGKLVVMRGRKTVGPFYRIARLPVCRNGKDNPNYNQRQPNGCLFSLSKGGELVSFFRNDTTNLLVRGLDAAALRQQVTAHNLANLNTPNFKRSDVSFEEQLSSARNKLGTPLFRTHERHFPLPPHPETSLKPLIIHSIFLK